MIKLATIKDVAKLANVSIATVSAVINKDSGVKVSDKLTRKVEKAIGELNYRPNRIAQALSRKETLVLAYIVPSITNEFFPQLAKAVEDLAFKKGYGVYLCNTEGKVDRARYYLESLIENRVAGVITSLTWEIEEVNFIDHLQDENIPIVGMAGARTSKKIDTIIPDDMEGGRLAVRHLVEKGYRNIGFIGINNSQTTNERLKGYRQALVEAGLNYQEDFIKFCKSFRYEEVIAIVQKMISQNPEIDALFVYNDLMGSVIIDGLRQIGKKIPGDIALVGFDDSVASFTFPKLTTMSIPKSRMADLAMDILFKRINRDTTAPVHIKISPELIVRNTS